MGVIGISKCTINNITVLIVVAIVIPIILNHVVISVMSLLLVVVNDVDYILTMTITLQVFSSKSGQITINLKPESFGYFGWIPPTKPPIWGDQPAGWSPKIVQNLHVIRSW